MKILYVLPSFQHPDVRGPTRHYHFVRELSQHHTITLLALTRTEVRNEAMDEMSAYVERLLAFDVTGTNGSEASIASRLTHLIPRRLGRMWLVRTGVGQMRAAFRELLRENEYDLVVFHGKSVFRVIKDCQNVPIVVDFCDATSMRIRKKMRHAGPVRWPLLALRYLQVRHVERSLLDKTPHVAFISPRDREAILRENRTAQILPNGVDQDFWTRKTELSKKPTLVFTGVMDYAPNHDAALHLIDEILPRICRSIPNVELLIVGRDPRPELVEAGQRHDRVTVTGFVDDVRPYLEQAAVFAAPLRYASGTQNKLLEALAMQVPVVTTPIAAEGLQVDRTARPPLHVADSDDEFAERVIGVLANGAERDRLAREGRRFVEQHFVWSRSAEKLEELCQRALSHEQATEELSEEPTH